jgi:probable phosphomutase (TIGR03848 family)
MPIFLLVRHGENDYVKKGKLAGRLPDVHLNKNGQKQVLALAKRLAGVPVKAVYSSPLERAMETADPIAKALKFEIIPRPGLIEVDVGEWQDQKLGGLKRQKLWKLVQGVPSRVRFPGGESFANAQQRICQELESLVGMHGPKDLIVCVSHSDPIKLAVAYFVGMPLDMFQRLHIAPASITTIFLGEGSAALLNLNYEISFSLPKG